MCHPFIMTYKLYKNSKSGLHCVQACLQMLLDHYDQPVLSLQELDSITGHKENCFTWLSRALLWLDKQGFEVVNVENLDYKKFAKEGRNYLKKIWSAETFKAQHEFSDLVWEQSVAKKLIKSKICLINETWTLKKIDQFRKRGNYFTMLSINPFAAKGEKGYGSHLVVLGERKRDLFKIYDPDYNRPRWLKSEILSKSISEPNKSDFNVVFVRKNLKPHIRRGAL